MKKMGYHTLGVGEKDLSYGVAFYRDSTAAYGLVPVNANLVDPKTGKLLFKPYNIEDVHGVKVGIFSVVSPENGYTPSPMNVKPDSLKYLNVEETVRKMITTLRPQCQVVVGLLNMGNTGAEALAGKVSGLDVAIVGGQTPHMVPEGMNTGTTHLVSSGIRGQYIARTYVDLKNDKVSGLKTSVVPLDDHYLEQEGMANLRKEFEDGLNERLARRQRDAELEASKKRGPDHFTGFEACVKCHRPQYDAWLKTAHSQAFATLQRKQKAAMPDCVPCHVTGYQQNGGYYNQTNTGIEVDNQHRHLENVQCEACHGMGTQHNTGDPAFVRVDHQVCVKCHTPEQDPTFNFNTAWAKMAH